MNQTPPYPPQQPAYWPQNQAWPGQGQPQQPQQQYPQPLQQPQYPQPGVPQMPGPGVPPQGPAAPPPSFSVNEQAIQEAYQRSQAEGGGFDGPLAPYFKWLGPNGETSWKTVPVGFERVNKVWVCQPPQGHDQISFSLKVHTIIYYEGGVEKFDNIDCWDSNTCGVCLSAALAAENPATAKSVKRAQAKWQHFYQLLDLQNPQIHYLDHKGVMRSDQSMRPLVFPCRKTMHDAIGASINRLGSTTKLVDPYVGRPMYISRKKTGVENRDVEYDAQYAPDQEPLPEVFWPALQNLWDLRELRKKPTQEDWTQACVRLGWPVAGGPTQVQVPANFHQGPMPPHQSPYPQQMPMQMPQQGQAMPTQAPPTMPQMPSQPPQMPGVATQAYGPGNPPQPPVPQSQALPPQAPLPLTPQQPGVAAPPAMPAMPPLPPGGVAPGPAGPPPPMNPPPIATGGAPDASAYAPQGQPAPQQPPAPSQQPLPQQQVPQQAPQAAPSGTPPFDLASGQQPVPVLALDPQTGKLPADLKLAEGRERCFGKHVEGDMMCKECPHGIKSQCVSQSDGCAVETPDAGLAQLQQQLEGGGA